MSRKVQVHDGGEMAPLVNTAESPLAWLRSRRAPDGVSLIADHEFLAGERLRSDYTLAGLMGRTTMNWQALGGRVEHRAAGPGGGAGLTDAAIDARRRVNAAIEAVGPELADLLIDVCCLLRGLADVEKHNSWPQRSGKVVLRLALAALARHYGLSPLARGPKGTASRHWGASDFKPRSPRPS